MLEIFLFGSNFFPALNEAKVEIRIQYKDVTRGIFEGISRNELVFRIQPNEAIYLKLNSKLPGLKMETLPVEMDLTYKRRFSDVQIPEAYEATTQRIDVWLVVVHRAAKPP